MARQKVSKVFYESKDVKFRFRWILLDTLAKEYEAKVIKLEEVLPLYREVTNHPLWEFTLIGSDPGGLGTFEDESRNFLKELSDNFVSLAHERQLPVREYGKLLTALEEWATTLGLEKTLWIYEAALCLLEDLNNPDVEANIQPTWHPIVAKIHIQTAVSGGSWNLFPNHLPIVPSFPMYYPWNDEADYREKVEGILNAYIVASKHSFCELGYVEIPDKRTVKQHCRWLAWRLVEADLSWNDIADRISERGQRETTTHVAVQKAVIQMSELIDVCL
jgi:hypothetical protein